MKRYTWKILTTRLLAASAFAVTFTSAQAWACNCPCDEDADCYADELCNPATGTCENPTDECTVDADCDNGLLCDGVETCDVFAGCVAGSPVDCSAGDELCAAGACDEESGGCVLVPQNDGVDCGARDGDICVLSSVCGAGACVVTPLCDEQCERCDPVGCASLCGNPWGSASDDVNTTDALFALRAAVELEQCNLCICDVDGDGTVTATDTLMMLRQIVGLGDLFVCSPSAGPDGSTTTTTLPNF